MGCIYIMYFKNNKKFYVGSTIKFTTRKYRHFYLLKNNQHPNYELQLDYVKYGEENLITEIILDNIPNEDLLSWEQAYFEFYKLENTEKPYYNIAKFAGNSLGYKHSEETKEKLRNKKLGTHHSEETKKKISIASKGKNNGNYGKQHSEEAKAKMSESRKKYLIDNPEAILKGENHPHFGKYGELNNFYGKKHTLETLEKIKKTKSKNKKTHCKNGHEFTEENTYNHPQNGRQCRMCKMLKKNNIDN